MKSALLPFQSISEFQGQFIETPTQYVTHYLVSDYSSGEGRYHFAQVLKANALGTVHRAYPCWAPYKLPGGAYGPCQINIWKKYTCPVMQVGEWFSVATFARTAVDADWDPVTVNIDNNGELYLGHVPAHGLFDFKILGPRRVLQNVWTLFTYDIDMRAAGSIVVSLDGVPALYAPFSGGPGGLNQIHFGWYSAGTLASGSVGNSGFTITEKNLTRVVL